MANSHRTTPGDRLRVIRWGGKPWRWRILYVHRSRFGGFRELVLGPIGFVWKLDIDKAARIAIHGDDRHDELQRGLVAAFEAIASYEEKPVEQVIEEFFSGYLEGAIANG